MNRAQIDNSHFAEKVNLRISNLPDLPEIKVLDMYSGTGRIWDAITRKSGRKIDVLGIEKKKVPGRIYLTGDNRKFDFDFRQFDVVDLDAYGVPYDLLARIFERKGADLVVFVTFITGNWGNFPRSFLHDLGYPPKMVKKIPTLFRRDHKNKLFSWLADRGVRRVKYYWDSHGKKLYFCIKTAEQD